MRFLPGMTVKVKTSDRGNVGRLVRLVDFMGDRKMIGVLGVSELLKDCWGVVGALNGPSPRDFGYPYDGVFPEDWIEPICEKEAA